MGTVLRKCGTVLGGKKKGCNQRKGTKIGPASLRRAPHAKTPIRTKKKNRRGARRGGNRGSEKGERRQKLGQKPRHCLRAARRKFSKQLEEKRKKNPGGRQKRDKQKRNSRQQPHLVPMRLRGGKGAGI